MNLGGHMNFGGTVDKILSKVVNGSAILSGLLILATALLVCFEVFMRYIVKAPTVWSFDVTTFLILYATYLGAAFTLKEGKHVRVDIVRHWLAHNKVLSLTLDLVINLILAIFWLIITWKTLDEAITAYKLSEVTLSYLRFPLTIPLIGVSVGSLLLFLWIARDIIRDGLNLFDLVRR
jgi:C4-dicarboxylate transporter DctQ subunit